jgi:hypothetical protein
MTHASRRRVAQKLANSPGIAALKAPGHRRACRHSGANTISRAGTRIDDHFRINSHAACDRQP